MVTSRHETHFDGIIFDFLLPWKLVFYSHLGDVVGYVGDQSLLMPGRGPEEI